MVWPGDGDGAGRGSAAPGHPVTRDEELVERARSGDRQAFRQLFLAHRAQVARVIQRLVPANEVEDRDLLSVPPVIEIVATGTIEDDTDSKEIEQPAELRLDHLVEVIGRDRLHVGPL